ncbi:hypothetical protein VP1G_03157 [Cytospora mali]|uniref:Uncharacterized protein n=1 Tax=Cytospora mali TaxID=578113 RepID=A0A194UW02_CYTMA|nr:hypothetical protein VP1G_03157 [Valsa mali var. pyri (nom. inval.)]
MSRSQKYAVDVHNEKDQREASINSLASRSTNMSRPVSASSTGSDTDTSSDSVWSTQRNQGADPKTKINSKGQVVTVYNHQQGNTTNEPTPSYNSAQSYGRR